MSPLLALLPALARPARQPVAAPARQGRSAYPCSRRPARAIFLALALLLDAAPLLAAETPPLGRLFFDAGQRAALDRQRQRAPLFWQDGQGERPGVTISGQMRSSSGRQMRWINGQADWNKQSTIPPLPVGSTYYPDSQQSEGPPLAGTIRGGARGAP